MDTIIIRPATPDDSHAIAALWENLVEYHRRLDGDLPEAAPDGGEIYVQRMIYRPEDPNTNVFVAETDGSVVGYVLGAVVDLVPDMFVRETSGFVADIYVETDYRGRGIGRMLMDAIIEWFQSQGVHYYEWYVASRNVEGQAFWRKMGGRDVMVRMRSEIRQEKP